MNSQNNSSTPEKGVGGETLLCPVEGCVFLSLAINIVPEKICVAAFGTCHGPQRA